MKNHYTRYHLTNLVTIMFLIWANLFFDKNGYRTTVAHYEVPQQKQDDDDNNNNDVNFTNSNLKVQLDHP